MSFLETKHEKKSLTVTVVIHVVLIALLLLFGFTYLDPPPENGIAVNFGTSDFGQGNLQPKEPLKSAPKNTTQPTTPVPQKTSEIKEKVVTQDAKDAPVIAKPEEETTKPKTETPVNQPKKEQPVETPAKKIEPVTQPDPKPDKSTSDALSSILNGPEKEGTAKGGEGNDAKAGDKGDANGDPNAKSYYGNGKGLDGDGNYRLGGRKALNKRKFVQDCNESGIVVVQIEVDRNGNVIKATPGVKGTTNSASCLTDPAKRAALATKFNSDSNAPSRQIGTIVYEFKISE